METIIVSGGAGFIGSCFVRMAIARGDIRVVNLDKLTYAGNLDSLDSVANHENYLFVRGDIDDTGLVTGLLNHHQPKAILNFAAETHVDRSIDSPAEFLNTNVVGTVRLLQAALHFWESLDDHAKHRFRFLHVSTDEVYGSLGDEGKFTETTPFAPNSPYSASKASADHFVRAFHHTYGLPTLTTNCSNNYGPFQFPEKLIPLMILNAKEGKPLPIYGDGLNVRDWLFVEDHCRAIDQVLERGIPGETYNVGGDCERTNKDVVETICQIVDQQIPDLPHRPCTSLIDYVTDRPGHDRRYAIDTTKIRREIGWEPRMTFDTGIAETVSWYLQNTRWTERVTSGTYARERLGLGSSE